MELSERSIKVKELISEETCMGTYGLVELELQEFDKRVEELETELKDVRSALIMCNNPNDKLIIESIDKVLGDEN